MMPIEHADIVVIDDDADILTVMAEVLLDEGYQPVVFRDGTQALTHVFDHRPALVMTDLRLVGLSGRDLVLRVREQCGPDLPIVVVSGQPDAAVAEHLPVQAYLPKPFELDHVCAVVRHWALPLAGSNNGQEGCLGGAVDLG